MINLKEYVIAAFNVNSKRFVIYIAIQEFKKMRVYFKKQALIKTQSRNQIGALLFDEIVTVFPIKYSNYSNILSTENTIALPKHIGINDYVIILEEGKQSPFGLIYNLELIKLEILNTYIKTKQANSSICLFKLLAKAFILFN